MLIDYILLSLKNLRKRGLRSWLTMLGIFLGIAAVVSLISLGNSLQTAITGQFSTLSPDKLIVTNAEAGFGPPGATAVKKLNDHDIKVIESVSGVDLVVPRFLRVLKLEYNKIARFNFATSLPDTKDGADLVYSVLNLQAEQGRLLESQDRGKVLLGNDFIKNNEFDKEIRVGTQIKIQGKDFEVVGILKKASTFQINSIAIIPQKDMMELFNVKDEYDVLAVQVKDAKHTEETAKNIEEKLRKDRKEKNGEEDFSVQTPVQAISSITLILNIIQLIVTGIAAISLLVGGIGIANTMFTSVLERTREIGIMKAIGAKNSDVLSIFLIESALLGLVGGIVGAAIGLAFAFIASYLANAALGDIGLKVAVSLPLLLGAISFSLIVGIFSGIIPSYQASKLNPVEALRR